MPESLGYLGPPTDFYRPSDSTRTYTDWLQDIQLNDDLTKKLERSQIAQTWQLRADAKDQLRQLEKIEAGQAESAGRIVESLWQLQEGISERLAEVSSIFEWGFAETNAQLRQMNDSLHNILATLKHPSMTWAYEQFERAHDLYRRGHYQDALEGIDTAIRGHAGNRGESTDHRFYYLLGTIRRGSRRNYSTDVVDLAKAEEAFVLSAKYAAHDHADAAAHAFLCAARAAYLQRQNERCIKHAKAGLNLKATAALHYELARALVQMQMEAEAQTQLLWAFRLDRTLIHKSLLDPGFEVSPGFVNQSLAELLAQLRGFASAANRFIENEIQEISRVSCPSPLTGETYIVQTGNSAAVQAANGLQRDLRDARDHGNVLALWGSLEKLPSLWDTFRAWNAAFLAEVAESLSQFHSRRRMDLDDEAVPDGPSEHVPLWWGLGVGVLYFLGSCAQFFDLANRGPARSVDDALSVLLNVIVGPFFYGGIAFGIAWLVVEKTKLSVAEQGASRRNALRQLSADVAEEQRRVAALVLYQPTNMIFDQIPWWALGLQGLDGERPPESRRPAH